jgi:hypothetical protein
MDPLKASIGLQRLVLRHYPSFLNWRSEGAVLIRLDQVGNVIGTDTQTGIDTMHPTPGTGYYAHIQLAGIAVGAAVGGEKDVWEVHGPDWWGSVTIYEPAAGGPWQINCDIRRPSPGGLDFLVGFA